VFVQYNSNRNVYLFIYTILKSYMNLNCNTRILFKLEVTKKIIYMRMTLYYFKTHTEDRNVNYIDYYLLTGTCKFKKEHEYIY